ncbi:expressed unknown protein [Seminavis robusta]|uniref:Uncharacterized protein n=1 Tax=Seminavis robusta TaxID=568900 RepID=A0A9N8HS10_9STRA|nr:expressed unknown protein [Seminavis robusta]|eukprot:Sro1651_g288740.1 n/a (382) ;mRNA; r:8245-9390
MATLSRTLLCMASLAVSASAFMVQPRHTATTTTSTNGARTTPLHMATWSDSKAVKEYQEFLDTGNQDIERRRDQPSVILMTPDGASEMAEALWGMGMGDDIVMQPFDSLPAEIDGNYEYPIYVTLPPWQIAEFIRNLPPEYLQRADDFVFFSGGLNHGNIEDVLKDFGFCRDSMTQVLTSGLRVTELKTVVDTGVQLGFAGNEEEKWAGRCTACGKWNGAIAERMERNNVICKTDFYREWRRQMWEDSLATGIFHLLGAVREEPTSIQNVANYYYEEASDLLWEMSSQLRGWKAITLMFGFEERMFGVAEANGGDIACQVNNEMYPFIWGNSLLIQSNLYLEYLNYAQQSLGLFQGIQLPEYQQEENSIMRKGNLRADGVV